MNTRQRLLLIALCVAVAAGCTTYSKLQGRQTASPESPAISAAATAQQNGGTFTISSEMEPLLERLAQVDFSEPIARMHSADKRGKPCAPLSPENAAVPLAAMTANERKLAFGTTGDITGWGEASFSLCTLHAYCYEFFANEGRWPNNAKELIAWEWKNDAEWLRSVLAMPRAEQYAAGLLYFVNPVTGRLYDTFQAEAWSPGGVNFRQLRSRDEIFAAWGEQPGAERMDYPSYRGTWLIEVWGKQPGVQLGASPVNVEDPNDFHLNPPPPACADLQPSKDHEVQPGQVRL